MASRSSLGVIDADFRGELHVEVCSCVDYITDCDERIAQLVVVPVVPGEFELVAQLSETARGEGGFGSTGV